MAEPTRDLAGRNVLITGGATGIGLALARGAVARKARVAVLDVNAEGAAKAAESLGETAHGIGVDVRDAEGLDAAFAQAAETMDGIDVVIANAGVAHEAATVASGPAADRRRVLDVNLLGVLGTVETAMPYVLAREGQIAIIASVYSWLNGAMASSYAVSKAGVEALARSLRVELARRGVGVTVAHYGFVETALVRELIDSDPIGERFKQQLPRVFRKRITPEVAAKALLDALERDAPRVIRPRAWTVMYRLRGVLGPAMDRRLARSDEMREILAEVESRSG